MTMEKGATHSALGAGTSFIATIGTVALAHFQLLLSIACAIASLVAAIYAIRVARATLKAKQIEAAKAEIDLCKGCLSGQPPVACPIPLVERPKRCPLFEERKPVK